MLKRLNNMQIKERLTKAFIMVAAILAAVSVVGLVITIILSNSYADALTNYGFSQGDTGRAMVTLADTRSALRGAIGYEEQSAIDAMVQQHDETKAEFEQEFANLERTMVTEANKKIYAELQQELKDYWVLEQKILEMGSTEDQEKCIEAQEIAMGELAPMYESVYSKLSEIMDIKVSKGNQLSTQLSVVCIILSVVIGIVIVLTLFLSFRIGVGIADGIAVPLNQMKDRFETFAKGDLSSPFPEVETRDEVADMIAVAKEIL